MWKSVFIWRAGRQPVTAVPPPERGRRGILAVLTLVHAAGSANLMAVLAMGPIVQQALQLSRSEFGLMVAAYSGGLLVCAIPFGWVVDRFGVRRTLFAALIIMAVATVSLTQVASFAGAIGCLGLGGVGYSLVNPATGRAVLLLFPQTLRATAMGIKQSGVPLGGLAAAAVGALAVVLGWQGVLWLVAAVTAVLAATCFFLPDEGGHGDALSVRRAFVDLGTVLRNRNLTLLIILGGGYNMAQSAFFTYLTLFLREVAQASLPVASLCLGLAQGGAVIGRVSWGVVSDRLFGGRRKIVIVLIGLTGAAALSAMPAAGLGPVLAVGAPLAIVCGLTIAAYGGLLQTAVVETADSRLAGAAIGYHLSFVSVSQIVGLPVFGAVVDWSGHYTAGWLTFAGLLLLSTLLLARLFQERRP